MREALRAQLIDHEGLRLTPYVDSVGKLTIGVGRNLTDVGISEPEALLLLDHDLDACIADLATFPWFGTLNQVRQMALIDLRFNLGAAGFRGFRHMIHYLAIEDCAQAAAALQDSKWCTQVGRRGKALVAMLATGVALLLLGVAPVFAQPAPNRAGEVAQLLGTLPTAVESPTDDARRANLYALARQLNARGDCCWGVLVKTDQGNKVPADILVWRPTLEHFDVMTGGIAAATWIPKGIVPSAAWIWQAPDAAMPTPSPGPPPSPPPPVPGPSLDLSAVLSRLAAIEEHQNQQDARAERIYADDNNRRDAQTAELKAAIDSPAWYSKLFGNQYVQLVLVGLGTYLTTHQVMK